MVTQEKEADDTSTKQKLDRAISNKNAEAFSSVFTDSQYYEKAPHICYDIVENALDHQAYDIANWVFDNTDLKADGPQTENVNHYNKHRFAKYLIDNKSLEEFKEAYNNCPGLVRKIKPVLDHIQDRLEKGGDDKESNYNMAQFFLEMLHYSASENENGFDAPTPPLGRPEDRIRRFLSSLPDNDPRAAKLILQYGLELGYLKQESDQATTVLTVKLWLNSLNESMVDAIGPELGKTLDRYKFKRPTISLKQILARLMPQLAQHEPDLLLYKQDGWTPLQRLPQFVEQDEFYNGVVSGLDQLTDQQRKTVGETITDTLYNDKRAMNNCLAPERHEPDTYNRMMDIINRTGVNFDHIKGLANMPNNAYANSIKTAEGLDVTIGSLEDDVRIQNIQADLQDHIPFSSSEELHVGLVMASNHQADVDSFDVQDDITINGHAAHGLLKLPGTESLIEKIGEVSGQGSLDGLLFALGEDNIDMEKARKLADIIKEQSAEAADPKVLAVTYNTLCIRNRNSIITKLRPLFTNRPVATLCALFEHTTHPMVIERAVDDFGIKPPILDDQQKENLLYQALRATKTDKFEGIMNLLQDKLNIDADVGTSIYKEIMNHRAQDGSFTVTGYSGGSVSVEPEIVNFAKKWYANHLSDGAKAAVSL